MPFEVCAPGVDEQRLPGETPQSLTERLAREKAAAAAARHPEALIIGSDQAAVCGTEILGKPGDHANAVRQLGSLSGRTAIFHTAVCVHQPATGISRLRSVPYSVTFRVLPPELIERYLQREKPYDCAGSAKAEGLGIALTSLLREFGQEVP